MEKLKIAMLVPFYNIYIKEFTEVLSKYVDEIVVFVHYNPLTNLSKYLPKINYIRYLYRYTKDNLIDLEKKPDNVKIEIVKMPYIIPDGKNPFLGDIIFKKVDRIIKDKNIEFDLLHAHSTWIWGYVGARLKKKYKIPLLITLHHDIKIKYTIEIKNKVTWAWNVADHIICVNKNDLKRVPYTLHKKVIYIPNGINISKLYPLQREHARKVLRIPLDKKILFSIGYLIERKGFNYLISAMAHIIKEMDGVMCFIGGEGPMRDKLSKQITQLHLKDYVNLVGYIPEVKKKFWLNATDVFVFPSVEEAFGIPVLEAFAVGTPVVATINGGSEEIIISEEYGLLAKPADPKDLAEKIIVALEKDWNRKKIRKYAEQFTWDSIARQTVRIYEKSLK